MEILKIKMYNLRNEEHFNLHSEVDELITRFTFEALKLQRHYPAYQIALGKEADALNVMKKSLYTKPLGDADTYRDSIVRGLEDTLEGACQHFKPHIALAAQTLKTVLDSFGDIPTKPYDQETAAINALLADLETTYPEQIAACRVTDWVGELKRANEAFEALVAERYTSETSKTPLKMKVVRKELDEAYKKVTKTIDSLVFIEGPEAYTDFVNELNQRIEKYNMRLKQRDGRNKKDNETPNDIAGLN